MTDEELFPSRLNTIPHPLRRSSLYTREPLLFVFVLLYPSGQARCNAQLCRDRRSTAVRSHLRSDNAPRCHSLRSRRFATSTVHSQTDRQPTDFCGVHSKGSPSGRAPAIAGERVIFLLFCPLRRLRRHLSHRTRLFAPQS